MAYVRWLSCTHRWGLYHSAFWRFGWAAWPVESRGSRSALAWGRGLLSAQPVLRLGCVADYVHLHLMVFAHRDGIERGRACSAALTFHPLSQMTAMPNHALQRTPGFGVQLPRAALIRPAQSRAALPAMKPAYSGVAAHAALRRHSPRLHLAPACSEPRPRPEVAELGSLGGIQRLAHERSNYRHHRAQGPLGLRCVGPD